MNMREFYKSLYIADGWVWLIQPCNYGEHVWCFTCDHAGRSLTHIVSEDNFTERSAYEVRQATVNAFLKPPPIKKKMKDKVLLDGMMQ